MFGSKEKTVSFTVKKYPEHPGDINLATTLQYDTAPKLREIFRAFAERVYQPAHEDWEILLDTGNTDGWALNYSPSLGLADRGPNPGCQGLSQRFSILDIGFLPKNGLTRQPLPAHSPGESRLLQSQLTRRGCLLQTFAGS